MCEMRGGALKSTASGRWVHIVCALALPEFSCVDVRQKLVTVSVAMPARRKLVTASIFLFYLFSFNI